MERSCFTNCINPNVNCVKVISSLFLSLELDILTLRKYSREFIFISILFLQIPIFCFETLLPKELQILWLFLEIFEFRMSDASDSGSSLNSGDESLSDNDQERAFRFFRIYEYAQFTWILVNSSVLNLFMKYWPRSKEEKKEAMSMEDGCESFKS